MREDRNRKFALPAPSHQMIERARQLRQRTTSAEQLLWELLRARRFNGHKFRRQHPIGTFAADFYCDDARLVIEIDGAVHLEKSQAERDRMREQILHEHNLVVLRFHNEQVLIDTESVLWIIAEAVACNAHGQRES